MRRNLCSTICLGTPVEVSYTVVESDVGSVSGILCLAREQAVDVCSFNRSGSSRWALAISLKPRRFNWLTGKALTSMRDNASAAGLFVPFTCLMSLVN